MSYLVNSYRFGAAGITDPTDIPNCVFWDDFSDKTTMTIGGGGSNQMVDITDKIAGHVSTSTIAAPRRLRTDGNPNNVYYGGLSTSSWNYSGSIASSIACPEYTYINMFTEPNPAAANNFYYGNFGLTCGLYSRSPNLYFYNDSTRRTIGAMPANTVNPVAVVVRGGQSNGLCRVEYDGTEVYNQAWAFGVTIQSGSNTYGVNRNNTAQEFYQTIVYDRVLTDAELQLIYDWLETKK